MVELGQQFDVHPNQVTTWKAQLLGGAAGVFGVGFAEAAATPTVDLKTLHAKIDGRPITLDEQIGIAFNPCTGGLDTVSTNIGLHLRHLAENQEHQAYLREHPEQNSARYRELLRAYAAVPTFRICVKETEVAGVRVMPGDRVVMSTTLACRDEQKYENL